LIAVVACVGERALFELHELLDFTLCKASILCSPLPILYNALNMHLEYGY